MAESTIKNPYALSKIDTSSTPFRWYKWGRVVFCHFNANNISTTGSDNKICDIPNGFEPVYQAEIKDSIYGYRIQFSTSKVVFSSEAISSQNIRGTITYISAN